MKIRVITLGGERMVSFQKRMGNKISFDFFNAFTPNDITDIEPLFKDSNVYEYTHERDPKKVIACAKSHLSLWETCISLNEEMLILEDDVTFSDEAAEIAFNFFMQTLNDYEYDVFFFDGEWGEKYEVSLPHRFHSGCAYIITPEGAKKILNKIKNKGFAEAVDWEILNSQNYGVKALAFERAILVPSADEKSTLKKNIIKLHDDIFLFENILTDEIIKEGLKIVSDKSRQSYGIEENSHFFSLINDFWFKMIEEPLHEEYLKHIHLPAETIKSLREFTKTDWRDLFFLRYYPENTQELNTFVHADFSTWTFSACFVNANEYIGGELCFPRQKISKKLNKGDMLVFPGGLTHIHYTENIKKGERIVLVGQSMPYKQDHRLGKAI